MSENKSEPSAIEIDYDFSIDFAQIEEVSRVFFDESKEILEELDSLILRLEADPGNQDQINQLFRKVHTIKGSVGAVPGGQLLGSLSHEFEALLTRIKRDSRVVGQDCIDLFLKSSRMMKVLAKCLRDKRDLYPEELSEAIELITSYGSFTFPNADDGSAIKTRVHTTSRTENKDDVGVWMSLDQLNEFLRISGELLVLKNFFHMVSQTVDFRHDPDLYERRQSDFFQNLVKISDQFQNQVQKVRKEQAKVSFQGLNVVIRQAATELNKDIQFQMNGDDLFIDKGLAKDLYDALMHVARNSVDHGIEDQFERTLQGKNPTGELKLDIAEKNNVITLRFSDDGQGLDREKIQQKAIKAGLVDPDTAATLSDDEIYRYIFKPGFSTKDKITTMSGRGVGMDVVLTTIEKYSGKVSIENIPGQSLGFVMEIPIPQHIMVETALLATWDQYQFAVPLISLAHISSCDELQVTEVDGMRFCQFQGHTVPLLNYKEILNFKTYESLEKVHRSSVVYIRLGDAIFGLLVDKIEAQTDLVVKSFGKILGEQQGCKGISILADEKVTYVLDPEALWALLVMRSRTEVAA